MDNKIPGIHSAGGKLLSLQGLPRHPQEVPPRSVVESVSPSRRPQQKGVLWPEDYVGGEEMAGGRGTDLNRMSFNKYNLVVSRLHGS